MGKSVASKEVKQVVEAVKEPEFYAVDTIEELDLTKPDGSIASVRHGNQRYRLVSGEYLPL